MSNITEADLTRARDAAIKALWDTWAAATTAATQGEPLPGIPQSEAEFQAMATDAIVAYTPVKDVLIQTHTAFETIPLPNGDASTDTYHQGAIMLAFSAGEHAWRGQERPPRFRYTPERWFAELARSMMGIADVQEYAAKIQREYAAACKLLQDKSTASRESLTPTTQQASTIDAIERWKETARSAVENIGAWRDASNEERDAKYWTGAACLPHVPPRMPNGFRTDTNHMVSEIVAADAKLDPTPLQDVLAAVVAWHTERTAATLPPQTALESTLDRAMTILYAVELQVLQSRESTAANHDERDHATNSAMMTLTEASRMFVVSKRTLQSRVGKDLQPAGARGHRPNSPKLYRREDVARLGFPAREATK